MYVVACAGLFRPVLTFVREPESPLGPEDIDCAQQDMLVKPMLGRRCRCLGCKYHSPKHPPSAFARSVAGSGRQWPQVAMASSSLKVNNWQMSSNWWVHWWIRGQHSNLTLIHLMRLAHIYQALSYMQQNAPQSPGVWRNWG